MKCPKCSTEMSMIKEEPDEWLWECPACAHVWLITCYENPEWKEEEDNLTMEEDREACDFFDVPNM